MMIEPLEDVGPIHEVGIHVSGIRDLLLQNRENIHLGDFLHYTHFKNILSLDTGF